MDNKNSKLVVLESNWEKSKEKLFQENKENSFVTKFFEPLDLPGEWEVAISEISFSAFFTNIPRTRIFYYVTELVPDNPARITKVYDSFVVPKGYYNAEDLGNFIAMTINRAVYERTKHFESKKPHPPPRPVTKRVKLEPLPVTKGCLIFHYDANTQRCSFSSPNNSAALYVRGDWNLFLMLGFTVPHYPRTADRSSPRTAFYIQLKQGEITRASLPAFIGQYQTMKISVDCIKETIVANLLTQEIGTVALSEKMTGYCYFPFANLHFVPVNKERIDSIKMECRDILGRLMPIGGGPVRAIFLFRRCQS